MFGTLGFLGQYRPEVASALRTIAHTPPSPAIPFVTSIDTPPDRVESLRRALQSLPLDPKAAGAVRALSIREISPIEQALFTCLTDYEREACELGYPEI